MNDSTSAAGTGRGGMIWGVLMLICGFLAIGIPFASGIGVAIVIGWLLLISAVWHLLFGMRAGGVGGVLWQILLAIAYGAAGLMITLYPLAGLAWLTLVLAAFLLIEAVLEFVLFFNIRGRTKAAGWVLVDAIITLLLGILIWAQWPSSSGWAIGTLVGVSLIFSGISRLMLSRA